MLNQLMKKIPGAGKDNGERWEGLDELMTAVRVGSIQKAASELGISEEALSEKIEIIENTTCAKLVNTMGKKLVLTSIGERFVRRFGSILDELYDLDTEIYNRRWFQFGNPSGVLRIGVPHLLGEKFVLPALTDFIKKYPDLDVELNYHSGTTDLIENGFDLSIEIGTNIETNHVSQSLATTNFIVCGSPAYFKEHGYPETPEDLKQHKALLFSQSGQIRPWFFEKDSKRVNVLLTPKWYSNSGSALLAAAKSSLGLAYLPDYYLAEDVKSGRLKTALLEWTQQPKAIQLIYLQKRHLPRKSECFIEYLVEKFKEFPECMHA